MTASDRRKMTYDEYIDDERRNSGICQQHDFVESSRRHAERRIRTSS
jgi:hypothetical protein